MTELKTQQTGASVQAFLANIPEDQKRKDAEIICKLMQDVTSESPKMWGSSIVGFGRYHYKSKSGRGGDWMMIGFSPRKNALTLYILDGYELGPHQALLKKLGTYKTGKGCLYINHLSDVDMKVLKELITHSFERVKSGKFLQND